MRLLLPLLAISLVACSTTRLSRTEWRSYIPHHEDIAGIILDELPETTHQQARYRGKHPYELLIVYWNGRTEILQFEPTGVLKRRVWASDPMSQESQAWFEVDYSFGSDPTFSRHPDPRRTAKRKDLTNR